ncbi:MAG: diguanylate cyclase, partial [Paracoccaceae bacterium]
MSMMFSPPTQLEQFSFRDYFALARNDNFACRLRTAQIQAYYAYLPFNLFVATLALTALILQFGDRISRFGMIFVAVAITLTIGLGALHGYVWKRDGKQFVSRNDMLFLLLRLFMTGLAWSVLIFLIVRNSDKSDAMMAIALSIAGVATMAFSTVNWPLGSLVLVGVVMIGMVAGVIVSDWHTLTISLLLLGVGLVMARAILVSTRMLMHGIRVYEQYREQDEVVRLLLNEFDANGSEWLFEFGADGCLTFASVRMAETFRRPVEELIGTHWLMLVQDETSGKELAALVAEFRPFRNLLTRIEVDGDPRWVSVSGTPKLDPAGRPVGYRGVGSDVTDRRRAAERIAELATFDSLTGLVNRRIIHQELSDLLPGDRCDDSNHGVALLFVDLDRFKTVNDTLGHGSGDYLLAEVARRMRTYIARNGCDRALVGRLGGDEFAITLCASTVEQAVEIGKGVIAALSQPYEVAGKQAVVGASIGLAMGPRDGATVEDLMRAADLALYEA